MAWMRKQNTFNNSPYHDLMVDIETMATHNEAVVISVGAVKFRLDTEDDITTVQSPGRWWYRVLNREQQLDLGRLVSENTMNWWNNQEEEARDWMDEEGEDVSEALDDFIDWCDGDVHRIWGNGNMFDNNIMRSLFGMFGKVWPVHYTGDMDLRTLAFTWNLASKNRFKTKRPKFKIGVKHNAVADAMSQVIQAQRMFKDIRGTKYYGTETKAE